MRKQIAAANWKMNCTYQQGEKLLDEIFKENIELGLDQQVIIAVPYPYLIMANSEVSSESGYEVAAQNCHHKKSGAFTGEVSAEMLKSINIRYAVIGHSERREFFGESNQQLADKASILIENGISPIFCCGEPLHVREESGQNLHVQAQLEEGLFHLSGEDILKVVIAYEPIWAIGTGKTASTAQAQEMHAHIRGVLAGKYGSEVAEQISILYGGSVKPGNAGEIFASKDVDGGLVGGASLVAQDFADIIRALKK